MKKWLPALLFCSLLFSSCDYRRVRGNGHLETDDRSVSNASRIRVSGAFDVELTQGPVTSVKIEADDNLLPYIVTREEDGILRIETKDHTNLSSEHAITVYITTPQLQSFHLSGSGNITGKTKFAGSDKLSLKIAGSGNISLDVNTPELSADISGSGDMELKGETSRQTISIAGQGDYKAEDLKSENTSISIAGSGDVRVFADVLLDVNIAGSGSVYYKGAASVKQHIAGGGEVRKIQ